jgi:hypothetical protein
MDHLFYDANELFHREVLEIFIIRSAVNEATLDQFRDQECQTVFVNASW